MKKTTLLLLFFATFKGFSQIIEHQRFFVSANIGIGSTLSGNIDEGLTEFFEIYSAYEFNAGYRLAFDGKYFIGLTYKKIDFGKKNFNTYENISDLIGSVTIPNDIKNDILFTGVSFMYKTKSFFKTADTMITLTPSYVTLNIKSKNDFGSENIKANTFGALLSIQNNYYLTENLSIGPRFLVSYANFNNFEMNKLGVEKYTHWGAEINFNASYQF